MNSNDPVDVMTAAIGALRLRGRDTLSLEARFQDIDVAQVVGRWPPTSNALVDFSALTETKGVLLDTQIELAQVDRNSVLLGDIERLIADLERAINAIDGEVDAAPDEDFGDLDASVVGKWPPD